MSYKAMIRIRNFHTQPRIITPGLAPVLTGVKDPMTVIDVALSPARYTSVFGPFAQLQSISGVSVETGPSWVRITFVSSQQVSATVEQKIEEVLQMAGLGFEITREDILG